MGRCVDCGFLTLRSEAGDLVEADEPFKRTGHSTHPRQMKPGDADWHLRFDDQHPLCFMRQTELPHQLSTVLARGGPDLSGEERATRVVEALVVEQGCPEFVPWQQGFSPRDHREMQDQERERKRRVEEEQERREFQAGLQRQQLETQLAQETRLASREDARDARMSAREDARDALSAGQHKEQMDALRSQHKRELLIFGGLVGIATVLSGVLDGAISTGWQPPGWPWPWWPW